jgi:hypothetical protein
MCQVWQFERKRVNFRQFAGKSAPCDPHVVVELQTGPKFGARAEVLPQPQRRIHCDGSFAVDDLTAGGSE